MCIKEFYDQRRVVKFRVEKKRLDKRRVDKHRVDKRRVDKQRVDKQRVEKHRVDNKRRVVTNIGYIHTYKRRVSFYIFSSMGYLIKYLFRISAAFLFLKILWTTTHLIIYICLNTSFLIQNNLFYIQNSNTQIQNLIMYSKTGFKCWFWRFHIY